MDPGYDLDMEDSRHEASLLNIENAALQGLEELSFNELEVEESNIDCGQGDNSGHLINEGEDDDNGEQVVRIDSLEDILKLDLKNLSPTDTRKYDFLNLEVAYLFYDWYSRVNGFAARKSNILRDKKGEPVQQTFLCFREGHREDRGLTMETRRRVPKAETRCGCKAKFRVHIDIQTRRWYVTIFNDDHNHDLLEEQFHGMLSAHRKMTEADVMQMNNMRKVGINTPHIYSSFANQSGGYKKIGFIKKDIYNQISKQRRLQSSDAKGALEYLRGLGVNDPLMFCRHTIDEDGRLEHLFWSDGISQMNYQIFGDVVAFDVTYCKNKYRCPLVVFSGVNHHYQSTVFAAAIVGNETEDTYVWLLEQFMEVMKNKSPSLVITDGDMAMRGAIKKVLPSAHHRLCSWHLLRNANTNIRNPSFTADFNNCMLRDSEVAKFEQKWSEMICRYGLEYNSWVKDLYTKRKIWAQSHIRCSFFAGLSTTSRCEGLNAQIGRFVESRCNLTDLVQHFQRFLDYQRQKEFEADFFTIQGQPVLQTNFHALER